MPEIIVPRVPTTEPLSPAMRRFTDIVSMVLNSFLKQSIIERIGMIDWDLTGDMAIGGEVVGGTPYLVLYIGPTGLLAQDPPFEYDPDNDVLRVPLFVAEHEAVPNTSEIPAGSVSFFSENADP